MDKMPEDQWNRGQNDSFRRESLLQQVFRPLHESFIEWKKMIIIPPYQSKNIHWDITFKALGWKSDIIEKFWVIFCRINKSRSGEITILEFLNYFNLDRTQYVEKCFEYFDTTGGNDIDFLEFMVSVWNICTLDARTLTNFTFDLYDLDSDGELTYPEIEKMVCELFGRNDKKRGSRGRECLQDLTYLAEEKGGVITLDVFTFFTMNHSMLLFPVFQIQRIIQNKVMGLRFWKLEIQRRLKSKDEGKQFFNPRHVQILLRTYKTGSVATILTHTGDPNVALKTGFLNLNSSTNNDSPKIIQNDNNDGDDKKTNNIILKKPFWKDVISSFRNKIFRIRNNMNEKPNDSEFTKLSQNKQSIIHVDEREDNCTSKLGSLNATKIFQNNLSVQKDNTAEVKLRLTPQPNYDNKKNKPTGIIHKSSNLVADDFNLINNDTDSHGHSSSRKSVKSNHNKVVQFSKPASKYKASTDSEGMHNSKDRPQLKQSNATHLATKEKKSSLKMRGPPVKNHFNYQQGNTLSSLPMIGPPVSTLSSLDDSRMRQKSKYEKRNALQVSKVKFPSEGKKKRRRKKLKNRAKNDGTHYRRRSSRTRTQGSAVFPESLVHNIETKSLPPVKTLKRY